jgi:ElaB/YqjD/DUF883 family membrane-anchored ribosome-binding protein
MTRSTANQGTATGLSSIWQRARKATAPLQTAAEQVEPLARTAGAAARHQADKTRAWAAPQVERAGQALQDNIAPKASSLLSAAAHRIDPAPRRRPWRKVAGASAAAALASGVAAFAAAVRRRVKAGAAASDPTVVGDTATHDVAPDAETRDLQDSPGSGVPHDTGSATRAS